MIWQHFVEEMSLLARRIEGQPDIIVSLVPGGMVPAQLLACALSVNDIYGLTVSNHGVAARLETKILESVAEKKVLLVTDLIESGIRMNEAKGYLKAQGAEVKTACLYILANAGFKPDFMLQELGYRIPFPWE
ncbi:phosphoribosyltransferase family protein [Endozoicomonas sp. Mp262]|uniref:phosphoribosyltransferase n=1 Tax=Endozoicomonas sp. Mp262 TaxID=2919499 RepID=UPI0021DAC69B